MTIDEFLKSKIITEKELQEHFKLVKEVNIDAVNHKGCLNCNDMHNNRHLPAEPWAGLQYCWVCNSLIMVYYQDRMGGVYTDVVKVYQ